MASDSMALLEQLSKAADDGDDDFLRRGVKTLAQLVMEAEVSALIGAEHGERAPERRLTQRNGYRERRWDTRVGTIDLPIPRLREGSYFPSLLEPRRRAERALLAVVQEAYVGGVSTRASTSWWRRSASAASARARSAASAPRSTARSTPSAAGRSSGPAAPTSGSTRSTTRCARAAGW